MSTRFKLFLSLGLSLAASLSASGQSIYQTPYTFDTLSNNDSTVGVFYPQGVTVDASGNVYVAATDASLIQRISPVGSNWVISTLAGQSEVNGTNDGTGTNAQFGNPIGIAVDSAGNLYVADTQNATIREVSPVGSNWVVTTIAGTAVIRGSADGTNGAARFEVPYGVALDGAGNLYVADPGTSSIRKVSPVGTNWVVTTIPASGFSQPAGVAVDGATNLFVSDLVNNTITELTPEGTNWVVTVIAGQASLSNPGPFGDSADGPGANAQFYMPIGVAVDGADNVYVADTQNDLIRRVSPSGTGWMVTTLAGRAGVAGGMSGTGSNALFNYPSGVAVDGAGNLFVADSQNNAIRKGVNSLSSYSLNILAGFNLIANQLNQGSNTLGEIMPVAPDGSVVYKYDNASATWTVASYDAALAAWTPAGLTLNPGEGAFFQSPSNFTLTFTGTPNVSTPMAAVPAESTYLISAETNAAAEYESIFGAYPPEETVVYQWDADAQEYTQNEFLFGGWIPGPDEPTFAVGEAVWVSPSGGTPPVLAVPPVITDPPEDLAVAIGDAAVFSVTAAGPGPLTYQWFANGVSIAGATGTSLTIPGAQATDYGAYSVIVSNAFGAETGTGQLVTNTIFAVYPGAAPSECCWAFSLDQLGGTSGDITSVTASVLTSGTVISQATGSGNATVTSSSDTAAAWSVSGLAQNPQFVGICFSAVPSTGASIAFTAEPTNQTVTVVIGTNGGCVRVVQIYSNPPLTSVCCDNKAWQLDGPVFGKLYSYEDLNYSCGNNPNGEPLWPSPRYGAAMVYHNQPVENVLPSGLLMFGGSDSNGVLNNETWMWRGGWTQLGCSGGIPARFLHAMAFDSVRQRTVLFGGLGSSGLLNDTWEWDSGKSEWSAKGSTSDAPSPRQGHAMAYFPDSQMTVLFGGLTASGLTNDTWIWDGNNQIWSQVALPVSPSPRQGHTMIYDANFDAILLLGGTDTNGVQGDMWKLTYDQNNGYAWSKVFSSAVPGRTGHGMASDPSCAQLIVFGGFDTNGFPLNDTWVFDEVAQTWSQPFGAPPLSVGSFAAAYYPPDGSLATFGGNTEASSTTNFAANASTLPSTNLDEYFYNPNPVFDGACSNMNACSNITTGPVWRRALNTVQFSFVDTGTWIWVAQHSFSYRACVASDQFNTLSSGAYPGAYISSQTYDQYAADSECFDYFPSPQFDWCGFILPNSYDCDYSYPTCLLYQDYALNGNFCPGINLNISVYNSKPDGNMFHIATIYADGVTAHFADSTFPPPCGYGLPSSYVEYLQYGDSHDTPYVLSNVRGPDAKMDLSWSMNMAGIGASVGEQSPCVTEPGNEPCQLAYFECDQLWGDQLRLVARVSGPNLTNASTLAQEGGERDFYFYVNADNSTNTGDQCCFDQGADFYVLLQQTVSANGTQVVTTGHVYKWNACLPNTNGCTATGVWQPDPTNFNAVSGIHAGITELVAEVPVRDVGDPQGCYSVCCVTAVPNDTNNCPGSILPGDMCTCQMLLARASDTNCPYVVSNDTSTVTTAANLSAPILVNFNKPMSVVDSSQVIVSPHQVVNSYLLDPDDETLDIFPANGIWQWGQYTVELLDSITDASGNGMCANNTFDFCVPDTNFYVMNQNGTPTNVFKEDANIYVHGCGFTPNSTVTLYLVTLADVANSGSLLADWTTTGAKQVQVGPDGCLPSPTLIGMATTPLEYKVVADVNNNGIYELNRDPVTDLCGLGLLYGTPCTNMIENDIVAWWPFSEADVAGPVNELINANNGVVIGPDTTLVPGIVGQARTFNTNLPPPQTPTYVDVPSGLDFGNLLNFNLQSFSIELWLNTTETNEAPIVDKRAMPSFLYATNSGYYFYLSNGVPMLQLGDGATVTTFASGAPSVATGEWSDVAVSVDQTHLDVIFFVNGNPYIATPSIPYTAAIETDPPNNNIADLWMAASHANPGGPPYFVGTMDELTMYGAPLSQPQAMYIFQQRKNGKCADSLAFTNAIVAAPTYNIGQWAVVAIPVPTNTILPFSYQWYGNNVPIYNGPGVFGATSNVLTILITNALQMSNVYVRISNALGYTYSSVVPIQILPLTASKTVLPFNGDWKYLANGAQPPANWNQAGFDDSEWPTGPGLFGSAPPDVWPYPFQTTIQPPADGGPITVYYRAGFQWDGATNDVNIVSTNFIQDGAVFYLNGVEVGRLRVPANQNSSTLADPQPNPGQPETIAFPAGSLLPGTNLLAVEVHQSSGTSTQDVFGMGLTANVSIGTLPNLELSRSATNISLSWTGPGTLQTTPSLVMPWSNLPATSPFTAPLTNASQFYKLQVP